MGVTFMLKIRNIKIGELEKVSEFIAYMNSDKKHHIGYCGVLKEEILKSLQEEYTKEALEKCFVAAYEYDKIVGILGVDIDEESKFGELWGPFVRDGFNKSEVFSMLWDKLTKSISNMCEEFGVFCNAKNIKCIKFAERYNFQRNGEFIIMELNSKEFQRALEFKLFEITSEYYNQFEMLHNRIFPKAYYNGKTILSRINEHRKVFIIKENNELLGQIYVEVEPEFGESNIEFIAVREDKQGKGLGSKLINIAINWIFSFEKIESITLCVNKENKKALKLYRKCGFKEKNNMIFLKKVCFKREGKLVYIKKPQFYELTYVKKLWADEETMKDVGGALDFPKEKWDSWYKKMIEPGDGRNFYCLIYNNEHQSVGEVSFHRYDEINKTAEFNIKIESKYRGRGYANEAMKLMLKYYFYEFGGEVMLDEVINVNGQQALKKFGFEVISSAEESISFRMTKERFEEIL